MYTLENESEEKTNSNQKIDQQTPQNLISLENDHIFVAQATAYSRGSSDEDTKHTILRAVLEIEMLKKCAPFWHEAHFQVKIYKAHQVRSTFAS
jgi:hypothetical protein